MALIHQPLSHIQQIRKARIQYHHSSSPLVEGAALGKVYLKQAWCGSLMTIAMYWIPTSNPPMNTAVFTQI